MKIGIDIDEVLAEFVKSYLKVVEKKLGILKRYEEVFCYNLWEVLGIEKSLAFGLADELHREIGLDNLGLVEGSREGIGSIRNNHELFFITARNPDVRESTEKFLKKNFDISEPQVFFSGEIHSDGKTKGEICEEMGIELMVEDNGEHSLRYAKSGLKVILLDKPWNQGCKHENIIRVSNWEEVLESIKWMEELQNG